MKELVHQYLAKEISRRGFIQSLAAIGVSQAGIRSAVHAAEAVDSAPSGSGRAVIGTGGELMVEQMKAAGVKYLFTNPGSFEVGFFDAFLDQPMQLINGLHEGIVIAMADGYHKVSREPSFVNLHVVAGTAQAAGQLYNSSRDGSSLVVTAGLLDNEEGEDNVRLAPRPGFDQKDINRQFTKISWETRDPSAIPSMLRRAFKVADTAPGGPVYLAVKNKALETSDVEGRIYDRAAFMIPDDIPPRQEDAERIARMLLEAKAPLLHVGDGVSKNQAQAEVLELAELLNMLVFDGEIRGAYHNFPRLHPLFRLSNAGLRSDFILRIGVTDTGGTVAAADDSLGTRSAWVGLDSAAIGNDRPFDLGVTANTKLAGRAIVEAVKSLLPEERLSSIRSAANNTKRRVEIDRAHMGQTPMHPDELGQGLELELDENAILISENLTGSDQFYNTGFRDDEKLWLATGGTGLGWGLGAAIGAKLAAPDRQVVCNIGDGSVMYSAAAFWTLARYEVPVLTVVCNNRNYQTVRQAYARYGGKMAQSERYTGMHLGDPNIDFVQLARSQGVNGARVEHSADLRRALRRGIDATRAGEPYLLDVGIRCIGGGADSTWHQEFSLADQRQRKV